MSLTCPACRSFVFLQIHTRLGPRRFANNCRTRRDLLYLYARLWYKYRRKVISVTPKTVLHRVASQWSFVTASLSMIHIPRGPIRDTYS